MVWWLLLPATTKTTMTRIVMVMLMVVTMVIVMKVVMRMMMRRMRTRTTAMMWMPSKRFRF